MRAVIGYKHSYTVDREISPLKYLKFDMWKFDTQSIARVSQ